MLFYYKCTIPFQVIFLIGNKCDLEAQRDVTYEEARQFAEENGLMFCEASAKTGESVEVSYGSALALASLAVIFVIVLPK
jgi:hypothetical protein